MQVQTYLYIGNDRQSLIMDDGREDRENDFYKIWKK